jgi:hypothetical protein
MVIWGNRHRPRSLPDPDLWYYGNKNLSFDAARKVIGLVRVVAAVVTYGYRQ